MFKQIIGGLLIISVLSFNFTLPELVKRSYHGIAHRIVNVTVGEQFSLPLPLFDSPWNSDNFHTFTLNQQQFRQKSQNNTESVPMDYLPFNCTLKQGSTSIWQQLKTIPEDYSRLRVSSWVQNSYLLLNSRSLLYILNTGSSELSAYIFNEHSMQKITTYKLNKFVQSTQSSSDVSVSPPVLATDGKEQHVYVFSSLGVWVVDTKTILSNVRSHGSISGFDSARWGGVDKVLHGQSGVMLALKKMDRVFIIPEPSADPQVSYNYTEITQFKDNKIFPQDIAILGNFIFVLDFYKGIFIFERINQNKLQPRMSINLTSFGGNYQFRVYGATILVNFNDIDGSKVAQLALDLGASSYNLVRFYKSQEFINTLKVFTVPTGYFLQSPVDKNTESSMDTFMFLLLNNEDIEIYPFNLDPRIIRHPYNALKLKGSQVRQFFHIATDRFIIVTQDSIKYIRLSIEKPSVTCTAKALDDISPQNYYMVQLIANTSTCEHEDHSQPTKRHSHEYCELQKDYYIHIGNPEASQHQKALLYGVVILVVVGFIAGLLFLMQWRNNKMVILGRLRNQIMNFRNRHKKMQPFVEENYEHKEIQIDVPRIQAVFQESEEEQPPL